MCDCSQDFSSLGLSKLPLESFLGCAVFLFENGKAFFHLQESSAKIRGCLIKTIIVDLFSVSHGVFCRPPSHFLETKTRYKNRDDQDSILHLGFIEGYSRAIRYLQKKNVILLKINKIDL